jgi:hypothetical protein
MSSSTRTSRSSALTSALPRLRLNRPGIRGGSQPWSEDESYECCCGWEEVPASVLGGVEAACGTIPKRPPPSSVSIVPPRTHGARRAQCCPTSRESTNRPADQRCSERAPWEHATAEGDWRGLPNPQHQQLQELPPAPGSHNRSAGGDSRPDAKRATGVGRPVARSRGCLFVVVTGTACPSHYVSAAARTSGSNLHTGARRASRTPRRRRGRTARRRRV